MIRIFLNGAVREFPEPLTVAQLLEHLGCGQQRLAVEVNQSIIPKSHHHTYPLAEGDRVELVQAMGGG